MYSILALLLVPAIIGIFFLAIRSYRWKTSSNAFDCPRYPHLDPFLGLDLAIQSWRDFNNGRLSEGIRERHLRYGPTLLTNNLGSDCIYTIDPENIRWVTTHGFSNFGKSAWVGEAAKHIGSGVLMNEGEPWKQSRRLLRPIFSRTAGMDDPALLEPHVQSLVANMRRRTVDDGAFDFHELASMFTLDAVTEFLFGRSTECLESVGACDGVEFLKLVKDFEGPSGKFLALGPLAWPGLLPSYRRLIGLVDGMKAFFRRQLSSIIAETCIDGGRKAQGPDKNGLSPSVFRAMNAAGIPESQIQGELQNIFFASYDTTSTFLANLIYALARHPDVQQRLREEVAVLDGRPPQAQELSNMPFLHLVIMEALRLYSPVSSHSRTAKLTTTLPRGGGPDGLSPIVVRAGTTVVWSTYSLNRDARRYGEDWAEFRPDRWASLMAATSTAAARPLVSDRGTDKASASGVNVEGEGDTAAAGGGESWRDFFMPFGSGPRACLGQQMVQTEVMYVMVRLLQELTQISMDGAEQGRSFSEAKAVSFYNDGGVRISAR